MRQLLLRVCKASVYNGLVQAFEIDVRSLGLVNTRIVYTLRILHDVVFDNKFFVSWSSYEFRCLQLRFEQWTVNGRRWRKIYWLMWTWYYPTVIRRENTNHKNVGVGRIWYPQEVNFERLVHPRNCATLGLNSGPTFRVILRKSVKCQIA
jgi:hypothetical protein